MTTSKTGMAVSKNVYIVLAEEGNAWTAYKQQVKMVTVKKGWYKALTVYADEQNSTNEKKDE